MRRKEIPFLNSAPAGRARTQLLALTLALFALSLLAFASVARGAAHPEATGVSMASAKDGTAPAAFEATPASAPIAPAPDDMAASAESSETSASAESTGGPGLRLSAAFEATRSIAPGFRFGYDFSLTNETSADVLVDLSATSSAGFMVETRDASGASVATITLAAGESTRVAAFISVPDSATIGTQDVTTLSASLDATPEMSAQATVTTLVLDPLQISDGETRTVSPGTTQTFAHTIVNSLPTTETIAVSGADAHGWDVVLLGPDDTVCSTLTVPPFGGRARVRASVAVPDDAPRGEDDTLTVSAADATQSVAALDVMGIRHLDTYASEEATTPCDLFRLGDTVYARAGGLPPGDVVCFVWDNANDEMVSVSPTVAADASGTVLDQHATETSDSAGHWSVELHSEDASGPLIETREFAVTYRGEITALSASDGRTPDAVIDVSATVSDESSQAITDSSVDYLVWWDQNGDGVFDDGDTYIDADDQPQPYDPAAITHTSMVASVSPGAEWSEPSPWMLSNSSFPNQGEYNVTAVWRSGAGDPIDQRTAQFYAIPTLGWPPLIALIGVVGVVLWRRHGFPTGRRADIDNAKSDG
jgi:hypothetical protein